MLLNINKKWGIILLLPFCFITDSCKKASWYESKPLKSLRVPTTLKDMLAILDYQEMNSASPALGEVGSDGHYISNADFQLLTAMNRNAYTWMHDAPYEKVEEWSALNLYGAYPRVYYCNIVLEGLEKITPANGNEQLQFNSTKGIALFQRARTFYELSQVYALPFNPASAASDLGIPLKLESDINIPSKRSTVKETYDQVIVDLLTAKDLLPTDVLPMTSITKYRPTRAAVLGLLARIYLSMEDYANAGKYAHECLTIYNQLIDYSTLSLTDNYPFPIFSSEVIWNCQMSTLFAPVRPSEMMLIDSNLYNLYMPGDLRKDLFFVKDNSTGLIKASKGKYTGLISALFTGLACDEIYLIRAECFARAGNSNAAMTDLNFMLERRWKRDSFGNTLYTTQAATDADDALRKVLLERKKELLLRGLRWSDLRRLNKDDKFKTIITRETPGGTFTLEPNSYKYTYPIPDDIIAITGMPQNPGW